MKKLRLSVAIILVLGLIAGLRFSILGGIKSKSSQSSTVSTNEISRNDSKTQSKLDSSSTTASEPADTKPVAEPAYITETNTNVLDLSSSFLACHTEPTDVDAESGATVDASIYGKDLSVIPTEVLVSKASVTDNTQTAEFQGIVIDFKPMIILIDSKEKTKVTFDLTAFNYAEGEFTIVDNATQKVITSFNGEKGIKEVQFSAPKAGGYAIIKNNYTLGIIEAVDDLAAADLEEIRNRYIK